MRLRGRTRWPALAVTWMAVVALAAGAVAQSATAASPASGPSAVPGVSPDFPADASSAASSDLALRLAAAYHRDVGVSSETTETSQTIAHEDGTLTLQSFAEPVRVLQDGAWRPVDVHLSASSGWVSPAATARALRFSAGGSGPLAQIQAESGDWLSVTWTGSPLPAPSLVDDSALYSNVYPGVDLQLTATASGFSEVLIVRSSSAAAQPQLADLKFGVQDGALTSTPGPNGSLTTTSPDGTVQLQEGQPTWWDSHGAGADADGPGDNSVPRPLADASASSTSVTINASSVAASAGVTYPVFVDPSFTGSRASWTYTDAAYPTQNYLNGSGASDSYAHSGFVDAAWSDDGRNHTTRAYFSMRTTGLGAAHVLSAQLNTKLVYTSTCTATNVALYQTSGNAAIAASTTWNAQPSVGTLQDVRAGAWRTSCPNGGSSGLAIGFDVTNAVTWAAAQGVAYLNLLLKSTNETDHSTWKKFDNNPSLQVQYNNPPTAPAGRSMMPCYLQCSGTVTTSSVTPTLTGQARDADGGNLRYTYEVYQGYLADQTGHAPVVSSGLLAGIAQNTLSSWTVPAGKLVDGGQYEYRVRAYDGTDSGPWSSGWAQFTVDTSGPSAPPVVQVTGATTDPTVPDSQVVGVVGAPITLDFSATDTSMTEIVYSQYDKIPAYTSGAAPACGSGADGVVVICRVNGVFPTQTAAVIDASALLRTVGFDVAGNVSPTNGVTLRVNPDYAHMQAGHSWKIQSNVSGTIPDTATSAPQSLVEGQAVGRATDQPNQNVKDLDGVTLQAVTRSVAVSTYGAVGATKTASSVLDMSRSFTVTAWAKPTDAQASTSTSATAFALMAQEGPAISGFFIDAYRNQWRFCMPTTQNSTFDGACARLTGVTVGQWTFITAEWDATNHELRVSAGTLDSLAVVSHATTAPAVGAFDVGVRNQPGQLYPWAGSVYSPSVMQGIATSSELEQLSQYTDPKDLS